MQLRKAERKQAKIKLAIQGASGSGKTMSALLVAFGLTADWNKIALIDTENGSADLYAHLGDFNVLNLTPPFTPESYIEAINVCVDANIEAIIIDSTSHCWNYLVQYHSSLSGNSFTNWSKVTPRQEAFINAILQCQCHVIATMRTKQDYVLNQKNGKLTPEKVGLKAIQREGVDYEFTLVFDIDLTHNCKASKDRTSLFINRPEFVITSETGQKILNWCSKGTSIDDVRDMIKDCKTIEELNDIYRKYPDLYADLENDFKVKKGNLILLPSKIQSNGVLNH